VGWENSRPHVPTQQNNSPFSVEVDVNSYGDYWVFVQYSNRWALKVPCCRLSYRPAFCPVSVRFGSYDPSPRSFHSMDLQRNRHRVAQGDGPGCDRPQGVQAFDESETRMPVLMAVYLFRITNYLKRDVR